MGRRCVYLLCLFRSLCVDRTGARRLLGGCEPDLGVPDIQHAYAQIFGQGLWTIVGSVVAFLIGQLIDVAVFHRIRRATGEKLVWLRATGSTAVSQFIDSFVVLYIAFVLGPQQWPIPPVPRRRHRQLSLQARCGDRADSAVVPRARLDQVLSRRG